MTVLGTGELGNVDGSSGFCGFHRLVTGPTIQNQDRRHTYTFAFAGNSGTCPIGGVGLNIFSSVGGGVHGVVSIGGCCERNAADGGLCLDLRCLSHRARAARMRASPPIPPTTPPTMGPMLLFFEPEFSGATEGDVFGGSVVPAVVDAVEPDDVPEALDGPGADESGGGLDVANACATVALKLSVVATSRYAHEGTEVPAGIGIGNLRDRHDELQGDDTKSKVTYSLSNDRVQLYFQVDQLYSIMSLARQNPGSCTYGEFWSS